MLQSNVLWLKYKFFSNIKIIITVDLMMGFRQVSDGKNKNNYGKVIRIFLQLSKLNSSYELSLYNLYSYCSVKAKLRK